jgi:fructose-1,6-bisphosphatase/inositol monophosphatase family enzyme
VRSGGTIIEADTITKSNLPFIESLFGEYDALTLPLHGLLSAEDKPDGSSVTRADREASAHVVDRLKAYTPANGVISEEEADSYLPDAQWQWAIDPLDGTASFARGLPVWGLGIGLLDGAEPVAGYLRFPVVGQTFTWENGVGLLNGRRIPAAPDELSADTRNVMITAVHEFFDIRRITGHRYHNLGSNLYHLLMLGCGRCEAIITGPCYLWDLAPGLPFTRALGHVERYLDGSALRLEELLVGKYGFPVRQPLVIGRPETVERLLAEIA